MPKARKHFAQHWLRSEKTLATIVGAAGLSKSDRVLEIGPGMGVLTQRLLPLVESVVAVEIDPDLCRILAKKLAKHENFLLLQGDFLILDLDTLLTPFPTFQNPNKVVANIPYNITGPILEKLLGRIPNPNPNPCDRLVLLVQKEVALRLCARPGSTHFGALSVRVQYLAQVEFICDVPAIAFQPVPKVNSAVIRLHPRSIERPPKGVTGSDYETISGNLDTSFRIQRNHSAIQQRPPKNPRHMDMLIKLGFASRRKMLRNNLKSVIEPEPLNQILEEIGINPQVRAEDLGVEDWIQLSDRLMDLAVTQPD
jgi:16S rRNA (adenine1518-N6/adenine1519-N6)-dimethyltransferase